MRKSIAITTSILFLVIINSNLRGQTTNEEIITTFLRPTIVNLYGLTKNNDLQNIAAKNLSENSNPLKRFDQLKVEVPKLILDLPTLPPKPVLPLKPPKPDSNAKANEIKKYNKQIALLNREKVIYNQEIVKYNLAVKKRNQIKKVQIDKYVKNSTNAIVSKWFSRDSIGNMSIKLLEERAAFSASDEDVNIAKYSAVSRISSLGKELMKKTYIIIHIVDDAFSYSEYYDNVDRENKILLKYQKKEVKPVLREKEGYILNDNSYLFKLDFNDSISAHFIKNYWVSTTTKDQREEKIKNWNNASFPIKYFRNYHYSDDKFQYSKAYYLNKIQKEPALTLKYKKAIKNLLPVERLKNALGTRNFTKQVLTANLKKIEDFKLKASVFTSYPISSKIGTKEGVKKHERWAIYEIQLDDYGKQIKKKTGYARITKVANNESIASGASPTSIFRQHGGKRTFSGMLLEPNHGGIVGLGMGIMSNPTDKSIAGFHLDIDFRINSKYKIGFTYTGNRFKLNLSEFGALLRNDVIYVDSVGALSNVLIPNVDSIYKTDENDTTVNIIDKVKGSTQHFTINFGREFLIGHRGNFLIEPKIGFGFASYNFDTIIAPNSFTNVISPEDIKSLYQINTLSTVFSVEFGVHILPNLVFSIKPCLVRRGTYETSATLKYPDINSDNYRNVRITTTEGQQINKNWGFEKLNTGSTSYPIYFGLKLKL
tara:strand:- start:119 stop:2251 length:2133 start_codon:yes stop_codon:yes gene_type:complete